MFDIISDKSDTVNRDAIQNAMHRFACDFSDEEADLVFSVLDLNHDRSCDLEEFSDFIKACSTTTQRIAAGSNSDPGTERFEEASNAVNKVLSIIPGSAEHAIIQTFR